MEKKLIPIFEVDYQFNLERKNEKLKDNIKHIQKTIKDIELSYQKRLNQKKYRIENIKANFQKNINCQAILMKQNLDQEMAKLREQEKRKEDLNNMNYFLNLKEKLDSVNQKIELIRKGNKEIESKTKWKNNLIEQSKGIQSTTINDISHDFHKEIQKYNTEITKADSKLSKIFQESIIFEEKIGKISEELKNLNQNSYFNIKEIKNTDENVMNSISQINSKKNKISFKINRIKNKYDQRKKSFNQDIKLMEKQIKAIKNQMDLQNKYNY